MNQNELNNAVEQAATLTGKVLVYRHGDTASDRLMFGTRPLKAYRDVNGWYVRISKRGAIKQRIVGVGDSGLAFIAQTEAA